MVKNIFRIFDKKRYVKILFLKNKKHYATEKVMIKSSVAEKSQKDLYIIEYKNIECRR